MAPRILIVDDEPQIIEVLTELIRKAHPQGTITSASTGAEALELIKAQHPDVVLLDVNMPGLSGLEVLKTIKQIDPTLPVIMVTGSTDGGEALRGGALAYLPKPFNAQYIEHLVSCALTTQRGR